MMFVILVLALFALAVLPMTYALSFIFQTASAGFVKIVILNILMGSLSSSSSFTNILMGSPRRGGGDKSARVQEMKILIV